MQILQHFERLHTFVHIFMQLMKFMQLNAIFIRIQLNN